MGAPGHVGIPRADAADTAAAVLRSGDDILVRARHAGGMTVEVQRPLFTIPQAVWDIAGALLVVVSAVARFSEVNGDRDLVGWIAALLPAPIVLLRRRFVWAVLGVCVASFAVFVIVAPFTPGAPFAVAIALYTVFAQTERRTALWTAAVVIAVMVALTVVSGGHVLPPGIVEVIVTMGFAAALGDAVRTRRAYIAEITGRALRAEATREAEASRRVAEDRLRIARDLHDVVAHQISVISLNAGVASSTLESRPDLTREALATIRTASRTVLGEIGDMLSTLRSAEDAPPLAPTVGLVSIDALVDTFAASGLQVTVRRDDGGAALAPAADVVAYRVIQEALTNAHKHGSGSHAHLRLTLDGPRMQIAVTNPVVAGARTSESGYGLAGIRERVASVRGTVEAVAHAGVFRLRVWLPLAPGAAA